MGKKPLEVFKFVLYITIPIGTVVFFNTPEAMKKLIERQRYIVYPPEGPRPPAISSKEDARQALLRIHNAQQPTPSEEAPSLAPSKERWWRLW